LNEVPSYSKFATRDVAEIARGHNIDGHVTGKELSFAQVKNPVSWKTPEWLVKGCSKIVFKIDPNVRVPISAVLNRSF